MLGTNDAIFEIDPEVVKQSILSVAMQMYAFNAPIVMISLEPYALGTAGDARNPWLELYSPMIAELWDEHEWIREGVRPAAPPRAGRGVGDCPVAGLSLTKPRQLGQKGC